MDPTDTPNNENSVVGEEVTAMELDLLLADIQEVLHNYETGLSHVRQQILRWERVLCLFTESFSCEEDNLGEPLDFEENTEEKHP